MIFATIGNEYRNFQRMTDLLIFLSRNLPKEEFIFQYGHSKVGNKIPENLKIYNFISRNKFETYLAKANFVITHAGAGTLLQCFEKNIVPLVLPRRADLKEHLNNHQLDILNEFVKKNLCLNIDKLKPKDILLMINNPENLIQKDFIIHRKLLKNLKKSIYEII